MNKPMFTTRHYRKIAEVLKEEKTLDYTPNIKWEWIVRGFIEMLEKDNRNFSRYEFVKACGLEGVEIDEFLATLPYDPNAGNFRDGDGRVRPSYQ